ncbi:MAG: acyltransferase [Chloroflexota bacterium]
MGYQDEIEKSKEKIPETLRQKLPLCIKKPISQIYWHCYDLRDFIVELAGWIPSHFIRLLIYKISGVKIGSRTSVHRMCRFYFPAGIELGNHTIINRDVLLDGRKGIKIGNNVSISEGVFVLTLEHDPNSLLFETRGGSVNIGDHVFIGARAMILPGTTLGDGSVIAAGSVVTHNIEAYTIVAGVPAKKIGERSTDLTYSLDYKKFLG